MTRKAGLFLLVMCTVWLAACSQPADEPAKKWIAVLDKHAALVKDGKFEAEAFKREAQPIVDQLKPLKDTDGKIPMSTTVKESWDKAAENFNNTCKDKGSFDGIMAFLALVEDLTGKKVLGGKKDK